MLKETLEALKVLVDDALDRWLPRPDPFGGRLHEAMRYAVFSGGKRLRPCLCLLVCRALGGRDEDALPSACALEMIHTYSLIHDDLPAMDDDDFRRGRPSCHKAFDEATAILAGDGLLTQAFEVVARRTPSVGGNGVSLGDDTAGTNGASGTVGTHGTEGAFGGGGISAPDRTDLVTALAEAAGASGMVLGQMRDLESEGRSPDLDRVEGIHATKTAAMIAGAFRMGALAAGADEAQVRNMTEAGRWVGIAFQVIDDILDITATSEQLGKTAGKDVDEGKMTYPAAVGLEKSREAARKMTDKALMLLKPDEQFERIRELVTYMLNRTY